MTVISLGIYNIPLVLLTIIYICIIKHVRRHFNNQSLIAKRRQQRDLVAIKRIIITINVLFIFILPTLVFFIMGWINGIEHPLTHRMTMLSYAMSTAVLSVLVVIVTPQLKAVIMKIRQRNQVTPVDANVSASNQPRGITTNR